ncbi:hypothetical protein MVEN_01138600 [Mycena venus]|uniref:Uncharacterized protein n=1 Tax=Mycena venus TaxID=2733690 RepID=A0A8H7D0S5_9AGAR|nr:hypothetical protein MVEN_01138600 [Mycena venus]
MLFLYVFIRLLELLKATFFKTPSTNRTMNSLIKSNQYGLAGDASTLVASAGGNNRRGSGHIRFKIPEPHIQVTIEKSNDDEEDKSQIEICEAHKDDEDDEDDLPPFI